MPIIRLLLAGHRPVRRLHRSQPGFHRKPRQVPARHGGALIQSVLITGASGFCGGHLVRRLRLEKGLKLTGIDVAGEDRPNTDLDRFLKIDMTDPALISETVGDIRPDLVFHLAGASRGNPEDLKRINFTAGLNLLEALSTNAPRARILLVGSAAEYGRVPDADQPVGENHPCLPSSPYGASKHALTSAGLEYAGRHGMHVTVARSFNIVGAGIPPSLVVGAVLLRLRQALELGGEPVVRVGNLEARRDFVSVEDAVDAYWRMLAGPFGGEIFNVCSGRPVRIADLVGILLSFSPRAVRLETDPALLRTDDVPVLYGDPAKARKAFGFDPNTDITPALRRAWDHAMGSAER